MRPTRPLLAAALLVLVFPWAPSRARAADPPPATPTSADTAPPRGPLFGNRRFRTEIGPWAGDADDYVSPLVQGETLTVAVAAGRESSLRPSLVVVGPDGAERTPALFRDRAGTTVAVRAFAVDRTGPWTVRVAGEAGTTGAYTARFGVRPAPPLRLRRQTLGDGDPVEREHAFEAVGGSTLSAVVRLSRGSGAAGPTSVTDPAGEPVAADPPRRRGRTTTWAGVPLARGDGTWRLAVGLDEGRATYDLLLRVKPPPRPRGTTVLTPDEPKLAVLAAPIRGGSSSAVRIHGVNFSTGPLPEVWFGTKRGGVVQVAPNGTWIDVGAPPQDDGAVVAVAVVNPDGQAAVRDRHFEYAVPEPPRLAGLTPGTASVYAGGTLHLHVALTKPAPLEGVTVALAATGRAGTVPPSVTVPLYATEAAFDLAAAGAAGVGHVTATYGERSYSAAVAVVEVPGGGSPDEPPPPLPDEVDVSGWTVVQAHSGRTYAVPAGTTLRKGDVVVIGRAAMRAAFEAYWGVTFAANVRYLTNDPTNTPTASDDWPSINGDETFEVRDATGVTADGSTVAMQPGGLAVYARIRGAPAGLSDAWTVSTALGPAGAATPGSVAGTPPAGAKPRVFVSEFADTPSGSGQWAYEFVELTFD